jgi:hypothetical protein
MKTILAAVLAVFATALLLPRSTGRAATVSSPAGRYAITNLSPGEFALMTDTATGAVWRYGYGDYCESRTPPFSVRQIVDGDQCKPGEESIAHIPSFERVSVEGLYTTALQKVIDAGLYRFAGSAKPKQ